MELIEGSELLEYAQQTFFIEEDVRSVFKEIVEAVKFIHEKQIAHRDLKLENILVVSDGDDTNTGYKIKIIDFGFACNVEKDMEMDTKCYTLDYAAPEILSGDNYTQVCDVWSMGVILYQLLCIDPPFRRTKHNGKINLNSVEMITERILEGAIEVDTKQFKQLSNEARDLIFSLLTVDVESRIRIEDILEHNWFKISLNAKPNNANSVNKYKVVQATDKVTARTNDDDSRGYGIFRAQARLKPLISPVNFDSDDDDDDVSLMDSVELDAMQNAADRDQRSISIDSVDTVINEDIASDAEIEMEIEKEKEIEQEFEQEIVKELEKHVVEEMLISTNTVPFVTSVNSVGFSLIDDENENSQSSSLNSLKCNIPTKNYSKLRPLAGKISNSDDTSEPDFYGFARNEPSLFSTLGKLLNVETWIKQQNYVERIRLIPQHCRQYANVGRRQSIAKKSKKHRRRGRPPGSVSSNKTVSIPTPIINRINGTAVKRPAEDILFGIPLAKRNPVVVLNKILPSRITRGTVRRPEVLFDRAPIVELS